MDGVRPFFLYLATGACHSPHQAPPEWIERYRGRFDQGWDAWRVAALARQRELGIVPDGTRLSPRPPWVAPWDALDRRRKAVAARLMECFAGFLSHADAQIGRVLRFLEELGELDRTIVIVVSDNGASAEGGADGSINDVRLANLDPAGIDEMARRIDELGGPAAHNNYPWGWTMAGNTPFKRWKREVHHGGVATPCIVRWPPVADAGAVRHQFVHAIDVLPTVLELTGIGAPAVLDHVPQAPVDGTSFAYLLGPGGASAPARHDTQYFETFGSRAIYHRGWKAVTYHPIAPIYDDGLDPNTSFDDDTWELYHLDSDLAEVDDRAGEQPGRLAALIELWWREAERNQVLPLDNRVLWALVHPRPSPVGRRTLAPVFPGGAPVPERVAVDVRRRSHRLQAVVDIPPDGPVEGVLLALGSSLGGWSFHVLEGRLRYAYNLYGKERTTVAADEVLSPGRHVVWADVTVDPAADGAAVTLACDGSLVGMGDLGRVATGESNGLGVGLTCGTEWGPAVGDGYRAPFPFTGRILAATIEARGPARPDPLAELAAILAEQ